MDQHREPEAVASRPQRVRIERVISEISPTNIAPDEVSESRQHRPSSLTRRQMLIAMSSAVALFGCSSGAKVAKDSKSASSANASAQKQAPVTPGAAGKHTCAVTPSLPDADFANDQALLRSDVRSEARTASVQPGQQIVLVLDVFEHRSDNCRPVDGARVEIWSAGFDGNYSGDKATTGDLSTFLRGYQVSENGRVTFTTIFPGWTEKRAPHINIRVLTSSSDKQPIVVNTQLFFDEAIIDDVYANSPYDKRAKDRKVKTEDDPIFKAGGLMVDVVREAQTLRGTVTIGLDLNAKGAAVTTVVATTIPESGASPANTMF
jgi:protocatechuate 3,4-dioxygenase beta subunit